MTKEEWKVLEKVHEVIRGDLWSRAKELKRKSQDESIGAAFDSSFAIRAKEHDTPLMRRLMSSKNTLMWAYTAALNEISLTAAYADDERDRDSKVLHTCPHVEKTCAILNRRPILEVSSLRSMFAEKEKVNVHRWFCLECCDVFCTGEEEKSDLTQHVQLKGHHLFISLTQLSCWCASCHIFLDIYGEDMTKILQCVSRLHVAKYGFELDIFDRDSFVLDSTNSVKEAKEEEKKKEEEEKEKKEEEEEEEEEKTSMNWHRHTSIRLALKRSTQKDLNSPRKKKRKRRRKQSSESSDSWIQCEDCKKWRKLPKHKKIDIENVDKWMCHMNFWDRGRANCMCPEEVRFVIKTYYHTLPTSNFFLTIIYSTGCRKFSSTEKSCTSPIGLE